MQAWVYQRHSQGGWGPRGQPTSQERVDGGVESEPHPLWGWGRRRESTGVCSICFIHPSLSPSITQTEWLCCLSLAGHGGGHCRWTGWTSSLRVALFSITVSKASGSRLPWCPAVKVTMPHHTGELTCSRYLLQAGRGLRRSPDVGVTSACLTSPSLDFPVCKPDTMRFWSLHFSKPQVHPQEVGSGHSFSQGLGGCAVSVWSSLLPVYSSGNVYPSFGGCPLRRGWIQAPWLGWRTWDLWMSVFC